MMQSSLKSLISLLVITYRHQGVAGGYFEGNLEIMKLISCAEID